MQICTATMQVLMDFFYHISTTAFITHTMQVLMDFFYHISTTAFITH